MTYATISTNGHSTQQVLISSDPVTMKSDETKMRQQTADLKAQSLIRVQGIIPIELNERLKGVARRHGRNADDLIGQLVKRAAAQLEEYEAEWEAELEAARLRERFGDNWLEILSRARPHKD